MLNYVFFCHSIPAFYAPHAITRNLAIVLPSSCMTWTKFTSASNANELPGFKAGCACVILLGTYVQSTQPMQAMQLAKLFPAARPAPR